jgi:uncharacterized membrane protein YqjE
MGRPMQFRNPAGYAGLRENLVAFFGSLALFLQSRLQLAAQESKAAARRILAAVICAVSAALLLLFGYIVLLAFLIAGMARLLDTSWIWVALAVALLHFGGALLCLVIARTQVKHPMFRETASVLKEDSEWLKSLDQNKTR